MTHTPASVDGGKRMMTTDLAALRALLATASPTPWVWHGQNSLDGEYCLDGNEECVIGRRWSGGVGYTAIDSDEDRALIVALVNAAPALLDEIDALRARLAQTTDDLATVRISAQNAELQRDGTRRRLAEVARELADAHGIAQALERRYIEQQAHVAALTAALTAIIYASDQCVGHADCGHSMEPWREALRLTGLDAGRGT